MCSNENPVQKIEISFRLARFVNIFIAFNKFSLFCSLVTSLPQSRKYGCYNLKSLLLNWRCKELEINHYRVKGLDQREANYQNSRRVPSSWRCARSMLWVSVGYIVLWLVELGDVSPRCRHHCFQQKPAETRIYNWSLARKNSLAHFSSVLDRDSQTSPGTCVLSVPKCARSRLWQNILRVTWSLRTYKSLVVKEINFCPFLWFGMFLYYFRAKIVLTNVINLCQISTLQRQRNK